MKFIGLIAEKKEMARQTLHTIDCSISMESCTKLDSLSIECGEQDLPSSSAVPDTF
jgi:hypothetical protein